MRNPEDKDFLYWFSWTKKKEIRSRMEMVYLCYLKISSTYRLTSSYLILKSDILSNAMLPRPCVARASNPNYGLRDWIPRRTIHDMLWKVFTAYKVSSVDSLGLREELQQ